MMNYKWYSIIEKDINNKYVIRKPDGAEVLIDLLAMGWLYWYVEMDSYIEKEQDNVNELVLKFVSEIKSEQASIIKSIDRIKWTAKK